MTMVLNIACSIELLTNDKYNGENANRKNLYNQFERRPIFIIKIKTKFFRMQLNEFKYFPIYIFAIV